MNRSFSLKLGAGAALLVIILVFIYIRLQTDLEDGGRTNTQDPRMDTPLQQARNLLAKRADAEACQGALQQFNAHLTRFSDKQPTTLPRETVAALQRELQLDAGDLTELQSANFTPLDAIYLEWCIQLRDATRALGTRERTRNSSTLDEAEAAFRWVVRQIRLDEAEANSARQWMDPLYPLRRGSGTPLDRATLFLGMLDQLGHVGCLLTIPTSSAKQPTYWACGVVGDDGHLYLFDCRLGIPLPGPDGKGIATMAQATQKDATVLTRLRVSEEMQYDIKPEQAPTCEAHLLVSLSSLASRMTFADRELLEPSFGARLGANPDASDKVKNALKKSGLATPTVVRAAWFATLVRKFYPESEGGSDKPDPANGYLGRKNQAIQRITFTYLDDLSRALPREVRPRQIIDLTTPPLDRLYLLVRQFSDTAYQPGQPRDLILRGRYNEAARELGPRKDRLKDNQLAYESLYGDPDGNGAKNIVEWKTRAEAVLARLSVNRNDPAARAELEKLGQTYDRSLRILVEGSVATPRLGEVTFLQALSKQEEAERDLFRLMQQWEVDAQRLETTWRASRELWKQCMNQDEDLLVRRSESWLVLQRAAQLNYARTQQVLAQLAARRKDEQAARVAQEQAANAWQRAAGQAKDLQALACLMQAQALQSR